MDRSLLYVIIVILDHFFVCSQVHYAIMDTKPRGCDEVIGDFDLLPAPGVYVRHI